MAAVKKSRIFRTDEYRRVEKRIKRFLNSREDFLSAATAGSPRAAGDAIQEILSASFAEILGSLCSECSSDFARRAMADIAFSDPDGLYDVVDVKTHRTDTAFNMPNLTSVERLTRFYEDDRNHFVILKVSYSVKKTRVMASDVLFVPIEFIGWDSLTIGALGWGQIQIADANHVTLEAGYSRKRWMVQLCDTMLAFYPKEMAKIEGRLARFRQLRQHWQAKPDDT